jgi:diguanylate cyclase (GGDEF)-like protein
MIGVNFDVSDRKEQEKKLLEVSLTDPLTGLWNRRHFDAELDRHWRILQRTGSPFGLIMIDFNRFKAINDNFGHHAGDAVLHDAATKLRGTDLNFRIGGDEMAVILSDPTDLESAIARISSTLNSSVRCCGSDIAYSCSVGGAVADLAFQSVEDLYRAADADMMERKRVCRSRLFLVEGEVSATADR